MKFTAPLATALATGLTTALLAAGCSNDNPKPVPSPSSSTSASTTTTSDPKRGPALPQRPSENSREGALGFVRFYVAAMNYGIQTGNFKAYLDSSGPQCDICRYIESNVDKIYRSGGAINGGQFHIDRIDIRDDDGTDAYLTVAVFASYSKQRIIERRGAEPKVHEPGKTIFTFRTAFRGGRWLMTNYVTA